MGARLKITSAQGETFYELARDNIVLGRIESADVVLTDPTVSRVHARIISQGGEHLVMDLQSRTGTRVNGQRVEEFATPLKAGDVITAGNVTLVYER